MKRNWPMALSAPDDGAFKAEFQVFCRAEADLLKMHPGIAWIDHIRLPGAGIGRIGNVCVA